MTARLVVIVGPTGAGKSELAIELAQRCNGEVLSADSQQVYRGMNIGTGKVTTTQQRGVAHHLIDILDPDQEMTVAMFQSRADKVIADAQARGVPMVVAGGTMLYVRVLLRGIFSGPSKDEVLRERLSQEANSQPGGTHSLWQRLESIDPISAQKIDPADLRRIIRALEVFELTGEPLSVHHQRHNFKSLRYSVRLVGLAPPREQLYAQINNRVDQMITRGLLEEVKQLRNAGYTATLRSQRAIGYAELHHHLDHGTELSQAVALIKRNSRRYARRQLSWYRQDNSITWHQTAELVDLAKLMSFLSSSP